MLRRSPLEPLSYERFLETHDVFEAASNQRQRIARWFAGRADARPLRDVVSIGSGGGDLDLEIMRLLAGPRRLCRYVGVDPNPVECARCRASFEQLRPSVEADVVSQSFESAVLPTSAFDLVYAVHTLYYVADVESALRKALGLLRDDGQLVLVQAPRAELNRLSALSWESLLRRRIEFSEDLQTDLQALGADRERIEAEIDVTACVDGRTDSHATALRDFILQVDTRQLDPGVRDAVDAYLRAIGRCDDGRWLVPHPVDAFAIRPSTAGS